MQALVTKGDQGIVSFHAEAPRGWNGRCPALARIAFAVVLLLSVCSAAVAQSGEQPVTIVDDLCTNCVIEMADVVTVGMSGPELALPFTVARLKDGRVMLSTDIDDGSFYVYDPEGNFLRRNAPDEGTYTFIRWIRGSRSNVYLFDGRTLQMTVLDSTLKAVSVSPMPGMLGADAAPLDDSTVVVNLLASTPDLVGIPIQVLGQGGGIRASLDEDANGYRADEIIRFTRALAPSRSGGFWSSRKASYSISKWTPNPWRREARLTRPVGWFPATTEGPIASPDRPPQPIVIDIYEDETGYLWVLIAQADERWREAISPSPGGGYRIDDHNSFLDTVIEVIDVPNGKVVARHRVDALLTEFVGPGMVASYKRSDDSIRVSIARLTIRTSS